MNKIAVGNRLKSNLDYKSRKVSEAWMSEKYGRVNIVDPYSLNKKTGLRENRKVKTTGPACDLV